MLIFYLNINFIESSDANLKATSQFTYTIAACDKEFVDTFVAEFKKLIEELHQIHGICGDSSCNFKNIKVDDDCASVTKRRKRRSTDNQISISFDEIIGYDKQEVLLQSLEKKFKNIYIFWLIINVWLIKSSDLFLT